MEYFKSMARTVYDKVQRSIEDEYIQPLSQMEIVSILNRKRLRSDSKFMMEIKSYKAERNGDNDGEEQILDNIDRLSLISPERQFKLIGYQYNFEIINYRIKELKKKNQAIKGIMVNNYDQNLECIEQALVELSDLQKLKYSQQKSSELRARLKVLNSLVQRTVKITKLNIKIKNFKRTLKIIDKIPNVKKMTLFQLKNINMKQIQDLKDNIKKRRIGLSPNIQKNNKISKQQKSTNNNQNIDGDDTDDYETSSSSNRQLKCIQNLQFYIDKMGSEQLRKVMQEISECLTVSFCNTQYQKAVKDFIVSKSSIQFQKLLIRLTQTEIRDKIAHQIGRQCGGTACLQGSQQEQKRAVFEVCSRYITVLINVFKLLRWHRYNLAVTDASQEIQQKIRNRKQSMLSNCSEHIQERHPVINLDLQDSIKVNTEQIKNHVCGLMDQCLKQLIEQILFNNECMEQFYQLLVLLERFFQIAYGFSSYLFVETLEIIKELMQRKCYKLQEKGLRQFNETLNMEEGNEWNRLPVLRNYRHKNLERRLNRIRKLFNSQKFKQTKAKQHKFLNINSQSDASVIQIQEAQESIKNLTLVDLQIFNLPSSEQTFISSANDILSVEPELPSASSNTLKQYTQPEIVLCQSSITILNYFDHYLGFYFYVPIKQIRLGVIDKMMFFVEYYIFYIFETFLSQNFKNYFFQRYETIQEKYLQIRMKKSYEKLFLFIKSFNNNVIDLQKNSAINGQEMPKESRRRMSMSNSKLRRRGYSFIKKQIKESRIQIENMVKARAMASQSIKYVIAYFQHIINALQHPESKLSKQDSSTLSDAMARITQFKAVQIQISDILLTDSIPKTTNISFVDPILKKIKWHQLQNNSEIIDYGSMILRHIEQVYDKMRSMSKGQIPIYIVHKIFGFYWKTEITYMTKIFLNQHIMAKQRGGRVSKMAFEKFVDILFQGVVEFLQEKRIKSNNKTVTKSAQTLADQKSSSGQRNGTNSIGNDEKQRRPSLWSGKPTATCGKDSNKHHNISNPNHNVFSYTNIQTSYLKIKNIFPLILQTDWEKCLQMIKQSFMQRDFVYKIGISIFLASESCSKLSTEELEERQQEIEEFIEREVLTKIT